MPRILETTVYQFDELSDRAKEKARDWYRQFIFSDSHDWEFVYEDTAVIAGMLGIDLRQRAVKTMGGKTRYEPAIYFSGFSSQGDGACFEGTWRASDVKPGKAKEHAPQDADLHAIAADIEALAVKFPDGFARIEHRGRYSHEFCTEFDVAVGEERDNDNPITDAEFAEFEDGIKEACRDFMRWIYRQLELEHDWQMSDECVDDNIRANEYEFESNGAPV